MNLKINRKEVIDLKISVIPSNRPLTLSDKLFCNSKLDFLPLFMDLLRFCRCEHFKSMSTGFLIIWNSLYCLFISRSSHLQMFCKRDVFKNFTKFIRKHRCWSLFFSLFPTPDKTTITIIPQMNDSNNMHNIYIL